MGLLGNKLVVELVEVAAVGTQDCKQADGCMLELAENSQEVEVQDSLQVDWYYACAEFVEEQQDTLADEFG